MKVQNIRRCFSIILVIAFILTMLPSVSLHSHAADADLSGDGTADNPFKITTKADLEKMRDHINNKDTYNDGSEYSKANYILTADIDLGGNSSENWYPIGRTENGAASGTAFEGVFDGAGYTITGLYIDGNKIVNKSSYLYRFGLFGENKGTIKNLSVKDAKLTNLQFWNGIIAATNNGTIENCSTSGVVEGTYLNGGIAGSCSTGKILNCFSTATGHASAFGGICGGYAASTATIKNNYYPDTVSVTKGTYADGLAQAMPAEDFSSGKIAWLLQNGQDDSSILVWEQKIGTDSYPLLHRNGDNDNKVYKVSFVLSGTEIAVEYANYNAKISKPVIDADVSDIGGYTTGDRWFKDAQLSGIEWDWESDTITEDTALYSDTMPVVYTIEYDLAGGTVSGTNRASYTIETDTFTLINPTREGYEFLGWVSDGDDIVGETQKTVTIEKGSTGNRKYTAVYKDATAPNATITIDGHTWQTFHEDPAFDLFYNSSQTVEISATDNEAGILDIEYYISNRAMTEAQLANVKWTAYAEPFTISPEKNYIIYAKVIDDDGNTSAIISTTGIVLEVTAPVIKGVTDGGTSCEAVLFTATDANLLSVTVDGETIEAVGGKYTVNEVGSHTVVALDKAGNSSTVSFTITEHKQGLTIYETVVQAGCETDGTRIKRVYCANCGTRYLSTEETVSALGHNWSNWQTLDMPTCEDEGTKQRECKRCGKIETSGLEASGHSWESDYTIDKEATCTEPGSKSIHCKNCPAVKDSEVIPIIPHTPGEATVDSFIDADCTEDGSYVLVTNCTVCGAEIVRQPVTIPAKGHDFTDWAEVDTPDCDDEGHLQRVCNICGLIETQNVSANGHKWDNDYTIDQAPTCTTVGSKSIHCSVCGATKDSEVIPSTGHTESETVKENVNDPNCTASGSYDEVVYCTVCNEELSRRTVSVAALGHDFSEWQTVDMPDCDDEGTQQRTCKVCGMTETRGLDATGHDWEEDYTVDSEPSCTTQGSKSIKCKICGAVKESRLIDPLGHDFGEWVIIEMNDCDDDGTEQRICKVCGYTETKGLLATGHDWEEDYTVDYEPGCTTDGSKSIHCKNCDIVKDSEVIPATGHTPIFDADSEIAATCGQAGYSGNVICAVCGAVLSEGEEIPATGEHVLVIKGEKAATCTEEGYSGDVVCEVCGEVIETGEAISALGHSYKDGVCTICGEKESSDNSIAPDDSSKPDIDASDSSPKTGSTVPYATALIICIMFGCAVILSKEKTKRNK